MKKQIISFRRLHYGWIVICIAFLSLLVSAGIRSTPGVLILPLESAFGWDSMSTTFPLAFNLALYGLCGPFAAAIMEKYGIKRVMVCSLTMLVVGTGLSAWMKNIWEFTLLWGLVIGIGTGFTSSVLGAVITNRWFKERKGLVIGILTASGATGQLVFLPLLAKLATEESWQLTVLVTSLASFFVILLVLLFMKERPSDVGVLPYGATGTTETIEPLQKPLGNPFSSALKGLRYGIRSKEFWLLAGSFFVCGLSTNGLIGTHLIPACGEHGIPEVTAASMLAFMGIFDIIGTTFSGWLSDRWDSRWLLFWYYGLRGLSLVFLPTALDSTSFWGLAIFIIFYGLDWVATVPPTVRLCNTIFGEKSGIVFGWIWASHQLGAATAAFGGGTLHALTGSYTFIFVFAGILCAVASGFVIQIRHNYKYTIQETI
ncbi:MFS transporter [Neobacillus ginsengisoli]|uniref:MFS family arabinose efflux permease n=1 Tax=Neobacillus ginsengisoli TaxID=904295 RepID=A0ABT9Y132_9BACI|nr:MFS transporter [Neobacillus ginsengisoli]MDQ0201444.1 putative MFS family arabinose efflux permease [Neobacillus ginsengisoli]